MNQHLLTDCDIMDNVSNRSNNFYSQGSSTSKYFAVKGQEEKETIQSYNQKLQNSPLPGMIKKNDNKVSIHTNTCSNTQLQKTVPKEDLFVTFTMFVIELSNLYDDINILRNFKKEFDILQNNIMSYSSLFPIYYKHKNFKELEVLSSKLLNENVIPFIQNILNTKLENGTTLETIIGNSKEIPMAFNYLYKDIINDFAKYSPENFDFDLNIGSPIFNNVQQEWASRRDLVNKLINLYMKKQMYVDSGNTAGMITYLNQTGNDEQKIYNRLLSNECSKDTLESSVKVIKMIGYTDTSVKELFGYTNLVVRKIKKLNYRESNCNESSTPEGTKTCPGIYSLFSWFWPSENKRNETRLIVHNEDTNKTGRNVALAVGLGLGVGATTTLLMRR